MVTEESTQLLKRIIPEIEMTAMLVQEISASSIEQSAGADQINSAMQQLNYISQGNAAASEELATSAEEMASQAEQLKEIIGFFKTDSSQGHAHAPSINESKIIPNGKNFKKGNGQDGDGLKNINIGFRPEIPFVTEEELEYQKF